MLEDLGDWRAVAYAACDVPVPDDAFLIQDEGGGGGEVVVQEVEDAVRLGDLLGWVVQDGEWDPYLRYHPLRAG